MPYYCFLLSEANSSGFSQYFVKHCHASEPLGRLAKVQVSDSVGTGGAWESAFPTSSLVLLCCWPGKILWEWLPWSKDSVFEWEKGNVTSIMLEVFPLFQMLPVGFGAPKSPPLQDSDGKAYTQRTKPNRAKYPISTKSLGLPSRENLRP